MAPRIIDGSVPVSRLSNMISACVLHRPPLDHCIQHTQHLMDVSLTDRMQVLMAVAYLRMPYVMIII